jgi:cytochrome P450
VLIEPANVREKSTQSDLDPLSPPPPNPAYYDSSLNGWVLGRYADVLAALHEPRLWPVDSRAEALPDKTDLGAQCRLRTETLTALSRQRIKCWQAQFADRAQSTMKKLPAGTRVDMISQFAEPLCLAVALTVVGAEISSSDLLNALAREISTATADPLNESLRQAAKAASLRLAKSLEGSAMPMSGPAFVALAQTLPRFLANAWLALLRHPRQLDRLRVEPDLMRSAMEELLRYAGLAQMVFRRASTNLNLNGVTIAQGTRVILNLASANRDPTQFPEPDRLDFSRRLAPQLALGIGPHSCAGGSLIKMVGAIATAVFVERVVAADTTGPIEWHGGSGFRSAKSLYVYMRQQH